MNISKEELLHIANLAQLNIEENEIDKYLKNLEEILNFANIVNNAPVEGLEITIAANEEKNRFRKDEVIIFENIEGMMANGKEIEQNMFKLPKVVQ